MQTSNIPARAEISAFSLKLLAMAAMLADHAAWLLPAESAAAFLMHLAGRIAAPIFFFFVAEGYAHTRSVPKYALRLLWFALLSYLPFIFFITLSLPDASSWMYGNVLFTLLLGLLALWVQDRVSRPLPRVLLTLLLCLLAIPMDWSFYGVLFILAFGMNRGNFRRQAVFFTIVGLGFLLYASLPYPGTPALLFSQAGFQVGIFLVLPLIRLYRGKKGGQRCGGFAKWGFYLFYPLHLLLIGLLRLLLPA